MSDGAPCATLHTASVLCNPLSHGRFPGRQRFCVLFQRNSPLSRKGLSALARDHDSGRLAGVPGPQDACTVSRMGSLSWPCQDWHRGLHPAPCLQQSLKKIRSRSRPGASLGLPSAAAEGPVGVLPFQNRKHAVCGIPLDARNRVNLLRENGRENVHKTYDVEEYHAGST
jgi:hypothetical protein